jgi:hypothetical protein
VLRQALRHDRGHDLALPPSLNPANFGDNAATSLLPATGSAKTPIARIGRPSDKPRCTLGFLASSRVLRKVRAMRKTGEAGAIDDAQQFKLVMFASPPPSDAEIDGNLLADALRRAIDTKRRRGGRPASTWRKKWGPVMVDAMQLAP